MSNLADQVKAALEAEAARAPDLPPWRSPRLSSSLPSTHTRRGWMYAAGVAATAASVVGLVVITTRETPPIQDSSTASNPLEVDPATETTTEAPSVVPGTTTVLEPPGPNDIESVLVRELEGRYVSIAQEANGLTVRLAADDTELATQLHEQYGDAINIVVGDLAFPLDPATSTCAPEPVEPTDTSADLQVTVDDPILAASGLDNFSLEITLANNGTAPLVIASSFAQSEIIDQTGRVVSAGNVDMLLAGDEFTIEPGGAAVVTALAGTASCDPSLGYKIPPGEYQLIATVLTEPDRTVLPPIRVTITASS